MSDIIQEAHRHNQISFFIVITPLVLGFVAFAVRDFVLTRRAKKKKNELMKWANEMANTPESWAAWNKEWAKYQAMPKDGWPEPGCIWTGKIPFLPLTFGDDPRDRP